MSEEIIVARRRLVCDLCGGIIPKGETCRLVRDDFQRGIVRFEHLRCPGAPAVVTDPVIPKTPVIHQQRAICFA